MLSSVLSPAIPGAFPGVTAKTGSTPFQMTASAKTNSATDPLIEAFAEFLRPMMEETVEVTGQTGTAASRQPAVITPDDFAGDADGDATPSAEEKENDLALVLYVQAQAPMPQPVPELSIDLEFRSDPVRQARSGEASQGGEAGTRPTATDAGAALLQTDETSAPDQAAAKVVPNGAAVDGEPLPELAFGMRLTESMSRREQPRRVEAVDVKPEKAQAHKEASRAVSMEGAAGAISDLPESDRAQTGTNSDQRDSQDGTKSHTPADTEAKAGKLQAPLSRTTSSVHEVSLMRETSPAQKTSSKQDAPSVQGISSIQKDSSAQEFSSKQEMSSKPEPSWMQAQPAIAEPELPRTSGAIDRPEFLAAGVRETRLPVENDIRQMTHSVARPVTEIELQVRGANGEPVNVRLQEQRGDIVVDVRTPDSELAASLRKDLGALTSALERKGYDAEAWTPGDIHTRRTGEEFGSLKTQAGEGEAAGEQKRNDGGQQQHRNPQGRQQTAWDEEFATSFQTKEIEAWLQELTR